MNPIRGTLRTFTMVFALLAIWALAQWGTSGAFLQARNLSNLLRQMSVTGILASGMVLIIVARQIDLSIGSTVCFLGAVAAILNTNYGLSPGLTVLITVAAGIVIGALQGYLTAYQRIPAFIVTLGGMMFFRGASMWVTSNTTIPLQNNWIQEIGTAYLPTHWGWVLAALAVLVTSGVSIQSRKNRIRYGLPAPQILSLTLKLFAISLLILGTMAVFAAYEGVPLPVLLMLSLMLFFHVVATQTVWGRHIFAIGGNIDAAKLSGIPTQLRTWMVFVGMGVLSAIGGIVLTARVGSASPDAGQLLELDAIASCVIGGTSLMGGKGTIYGALLGALVMESLNNSMSLANMEPYWQYCVKGLVLVMAVWVDMASQKQA